MAVELLLKTLAATLIACVACAYAIGWARLRRRGHAPPAWRLTLYTTGLVALAAAILSPIDDLAQRAFAAHMIQHQLLTMAAAPLLLLGNPLAVILWGLPPRVRRPLARPLRPGASVRRALSTLTLLPVAWLTHVAALWLWHLPVLYDAALEHEIVHAIEHGTFLATAILFWWPIVGPAPRLHRPAHTGFTILYLVAATAQNTLLGMALTLAERTFYHHYAAVARTLGTSAVDDQMLAGGIMWMGGHMYLLPILLILWRVAHHARDESLPAEPSRA